MKSRKSSQRGKKEPRKLRVREAKGEGTFQERGGGNRVNCRRVAKKNEDKKRPLGL